MGDLYWVGVGTWDASTTTNWSATNGGAGGASVPTKDDDVHFTSSSSGNCTIAAGVTVVARSVDYTGYTHTVIRGNSSSGLKVGSTAAAPSSSTLLLVAGMVWPNTLAITFAGTSGTVETITTGGQSVGALTFDGVGGSWKLADAVTQAAGNLVTLTNGILDFNSLAHHLSGFQSNNSNVRAIKNLTTLNFGSTGGNVWNSTSTLVVDASLATSTINVTDTGSSSKGLQFNDCGLSFGTINVTGGGTGAIAIHASGGTCNIAALIINGPKTTKFDHGTTWAITTLTLNSSVGNVITLASDVGGAAATVSLTHQLAADYLSVQDITAAGATPFYAGDPAHSTLVSNTTNWLLQLVSLVSAVESSQTSESVVAFSSFLPAVAREVSQVSESGVAQPTEQVAVAESSLVLESPKAAPEYNTFVAEVVSTADSAFPALVHLVFVRNDVAIGESVFAPFPGPTVALDGATVGDAPGISLVAFVVASDKVAAFDTASRQMPIPTSFVHGLEAVQVATTPSPHLPVRWRTYIGTVHPSWPQGRNRS